MDQQQYLLWIDCEMTGLNHHQDQIIEIAALITDQHLNLVQEGPQIIINCPNHLLDNMDQWCTNTHAQSGLTQKVKHSKFTIQYAEQSILQFVQKYQQQPKKMVLCGNSIHVDRLFLVDQMPTLIAFLHYRIIDVSSIKELCRMWYPDKFRSVPAKKSSHRAIDDIKESLEELKFYKANIFQ